MRGAYLFGTLALAASTAAAQPADRWSFLGRVGDTLTYQVRQTTTVDELAPDDRAKAPVAIKTVTQLTSTKSWKQVSADKGTRTYQLTIGAMRQELTQTVGDAKPNVRVVDSAAADDAKAMPFLGKPILTVTLDDRGEFVSAKADEKTASDRLRAELPFRLVLPAQIPELKGAWTRGLNLTLPPPQGAGEKFAGTQAFTFRGRKDDFAVIGLKTELKERPADDAVYAALVPTLWEGDLFFDTKAGRYHGARLKVDREVANHRGEGTKFRYASEYTEALDTKAK